MGSLPLSVCIALIPGAISQQSVTSGWRNWVPWNQYWTVVEQRLPEVWSAKVHKKRLLAVKRFELPLDSSVEQRALFLRESISRWLACPNEALIYVLAHSQGGLDVRYLRRALKFKRVSSLVTVGTPHRGAELAAYAVRQREENTWIYRLLRWGGYDLKRLDFLDQLAPGFVAKHSRAFAVELDFDSAGYVESDCVTARNCSFLLRLAHGLFSAPIQGVALPGDGLVSAASQSWGERIVTLHWDHRAEVLAVPRYEPLQLEMLRRVVDFWQREGQN